MLRKAGENRENEINEALISLKELEQRLTEDLEKFQKRQKRNLNEIRRRLPSSKRPLQINIEEILEDWSVKENITKNNENEAREKHEAIKYVQNERKCAIENEESADSSGVFSFLLSDENSSSSSSSTDVNINKAILKETNESGEAAHKQNNDVCVSKQLQKGK